MSHQRSSVVIGERRISADQPPYIIAEIGVNHDGSVDRAVELVHAAKRASADAIKLQIFEAQRLLSSAARLATYQANSAASDPIAMLRGLELSVDQVRPVVEAAHRLDLHAIATVFSVELVGHAEVLAWDAYKTASPDIINRPLIESLISTGKPLIVSAGASTMEEIEQATCWMAEHPFLLMQCVSCYPTPDDSAALAGRIAMARVHPTALGYSDHTISIDTGALAVASGARVLEKHLTYDSRAIGPDHAASLDPDSFAEYVRLSRRAYSMLGSEQKVLLEIERDVHEASRQSVTSTRALRAGHVLGRADVTIKRPGTGISPAHLADIIGRRLAKPIDADMPISAEFIE
jgi:N,N'-diacetyllegionaminate synthase